MLYWQDLFETMLDFQRMEKLEFGGLKGKVYSEHAAQMYREFTKHCQALMHSDNSLLDCSQVNYYYFLIYLHSLLILNQTGFRESEYIVLFWFQSTLSVLFSSSKRILKMNTRSSK